MIIETHPRVPANPNYSNFFGVILPVPLVLTVFLISCQTWQCDWTTRTVRKTTMFSCFVKTLQTHYFKYNYIIDFYF